MGRVNSQAQAISSYERDGYVIFRNVLSPELVDEASGHVDWLQGQHPDLRPEQLHHTLMVDDPFWVRLVSEPSLVDIAASFVGPDVALFASHYICKPPFSGEPVLWHQDAAYWPLEPMEVVTLWLAIDRSSSENGCVRLIPGSHRQEVFGLRSNDKVASVLGTESAVEVDESEAVDMVLEPGDVEVHHPNIMHSSGPNLSPHRRCGLTIRYIPTSTRIVSDEQPFPSAFLLRGDPGVNQYQPRPHYVEGRHYAFTGADQWG